MSGPRLVEVRANVLKRNDMLARSLRERFHQSGVFVISLVSSPGAGKTKLLDARQCQSIEHGVVALHAL